jgi:hypothetical protein
LAQEKDKYVKEPRNGRRWSQHSYLPYAPNALRFMLKKQGEGQKVIEKRAVYAPTVVFEGKSK